MVTRTLPKPEWTAYFEEISRHLSGQHAQVEIVGLQLGNQKIAEDVNLLGITYEPRRDEIDIALEGLDHLVTAPSAVSIVEGPEGLESMEIIDGEQRHQIIQLKSPLRIPGPSDR